MQRYKRPALIGIITTIDCSNYRYKNQLQMIFVTPSIRYKAKKTSAEASPEWQQKGEFSKDLERLIMAEDMATIEPQETPDRCAKGKEWKGECTNDGSVDWYGNPAVRSKSGGWLAAVLLLVNQGLITLAFFGVAANLVLFLTRVMHMENADAANHVSNWVGTAYMFSIVGAFISDSFWGRFKTCFIFQLIFLTGLVELSFTSYYLLQKSCYSYEANSKSCKTPTHFEALIFYMSIYQIALGNGGYQPAITAFGADQFDAESLEEQKSKMAFFSYFFVANNVGSLFSDIVLTYLQDKGRWALSFAFSAAASFLGVVLFFSGTLHFRYFKPGGNPLVRISHVIVASVKNRTVKAPQAEYLYEADGKNCAMRKIIHTPEFKCLDKAAVVLHPALSSESTQKESSEQWAPCTVTQVEEVKCILRLFPIWICTVVYSIAYNQMSSVFIEQGEAMNKAVSNLQIPPGSMNVFEILGVSGFIVLYQFCISPFMLKVLKKDLTELQRMGIGFIVSVMAMFSAGLVELYRLKHQRVCTNRCKASSSLSILWQMPQYVLVGASEVFTYVGMMEFFNKESPDGLKSFASALYVASMSAGSYLSEIIVMVIVKASGKESRESWISDNLNHGHMDNFYFLIGLLNVLGFILFVLCAKKYRGIQFAGHNDEIETLKKNDEIETLVIKGGEDDLRTNEEEEVAQIEEIEVYLEA